MPHRSTFANQPEPYEHKFYSSPEIQNPFQDSMSMSKSLGFDIPELKGNMYEQSDPKLLEEHKDYEMTREMLGHHNIPPLKEFQPQEKL